MSLLRLTGDWSDPSVDLREASAGAQSRDRLGGIRTLLLPPKSPQAGGKIVVAVLWENAGDEDVCTIPLICGTVYVNDIAVDLGCSGFNGHFTARTNGVWTEPWDISTAVTEAGSYRLRFEAGPVRSKEIVIEVARPR